jgi:hypothetical protein
MAHNEEDVLKIIFVLELQGTSYHSGVKAAVRVAARHRFAPKRNSKPHSLV